MLVFKKDALFSGIDPSDSKAFKDDPLDMTHIENVLKAYLNGMSLETACSTEILKPQYDDCIFFHNVSKKEFLQQYAHEVCNVPNQYDAERQELCTINYVLFDLDNNKILIPDYSVQKEQMEIRSAVIELHSMADLYKHLYGYLDDHKHYKYAFENDLIVTQSPLEPYTTHGEYGIIMSFCVEFQSLNNVGSKPFIMKYNECCKKTTVPEFICNCSKSDKDNAFDLKTML